MSLPTINMKDGVVPYNNKISDLVKKTPDNARRTLGLAIDNTALFSFVGNFKDLLSIKLLGFVDNNPTSPPTIRLLGFSPFWEGGTSQYMYKHGSQTNKAGFVTGMSNLLNEPLVLSTWKNADGVIKNTEIRFYDFLTGVPVNVDGTLYFEIESGYWGI